MSSRVSDYRIEVAPRFAALPWGAAALPPRRYTGHSCLVLSGTLRRQECPRHLPWRGAAAPFLAGAAGSVSSPALTHPAGAQLLFTCFPGVLPQAKQRSAPLGRTSINTNIKCSAGRYPRVGRGFQSPARRGGQLTSAQNQPPQTSLSNWLVVMPARVRLPHASRAGDWKPRPTPTTPLLAGASGSVP